MNGNVIGNILSFFIITSISCLIHTIYPLFGIEVSDVRISVGVSLFLGLALFFIFRKLLTQKIIEILLFIVKKTMKEKIGLVQIYSNFSSAQKDFLEDFRQSSKARIQIQMGRNLIGGKPSLLFEEICKRKNDQFHMEILFLDIRSKSLSKENALSRKTDYNEWAVFVRHNKENISVIEKKGVSIEARTHDEPYLWRLFFLDKHLYFLPYLFNKNNDHYAPVLKFKDFGESKPSLYTIFDKYFTNLWEKQNQSVYAPGEKKKTIV